MNTRPGIHSLTLYFVMALLLGLPLTSALAADITVDADCSLANAVRSANGEEQVAPLADCEAGDSPVDETNTGADTITIDVTGTADGTIYLEATLGVSSEITIEGKGYTVDGRAKRIFNVTAGALSLSNLTLISGFAVENGGAISVTEAALRLENSAVRGSGARGYGGGIYALDSDVDLINSVISGNVTGPDARDSITLTDPEPEKSDPENVLLSPQTADGTEADEIVEAEAQLSEEDEAVLVIALDAPEEDLPDVEGSSGGGLYFAGEDHTLNVSKSGFDNNTSTENGGGIAIASGTANFNDSTINANRAEGSGGGLHNAGNTAMRHVTIVLNWATAGGGVADAATLQLYNSILSENAGGDCDGALNANLGNIIRDGSCNHDGATDDPDLLLLAGSPAYYLPQVDSPAIDAALADWCTESDQRDIVRLPEACDIGAAEHQAGAFQFQIQSALAALSPGSGGSSGGSGGDDDEPASTPMPSLCASLPAHIAVTGYTYSSHCKHVDYRGVGSKLLVDHGAIQAVDIFGWVAAPMKTCFLHGPSAIVMLDAATAPRTLIPLRTWTEGGWQCATIDSIGTVVLMPLEFFTSGAIPEPIWDLTGCTVTTTDILNLRSAPNGASEVLANVLNDVQLTADQRATHFYRVSYYDFIGWLSDDYLTYEGVCH